MANLQQERPPKWGSQWEELFESPLHLNAHNRSTPKKGPLKTLASQNLTRDATSFRGLFTDIHSYQRQSSYREQGYSW